MLNLKKRKMTTKELTKSSLFIALIAIGAQIKVPIPYIPFTLQFLFTNLCGLLLGGDVALMCILSYVIMGLIGLPVFTTGGGISYIFSPSFGYLIGFAIGAYFAGKFMENKVYNNKNIFIAGLINIITVYLLGAIYFYLISNFYLGNPSTIKNVLLYCILLPMPADLFLCLVSIPIAKRLRRAIFWKKEFL